MFLVPPHVNHHPSILEAIYGRARSSNYAVSIGSCKSTLVSPALNGDGELALRTITPCRFVVKLPTDTHDINSGEQKKRKKERKNKKSSAQFEVA